MGCDGAAQAYTRKHSLCDASIVSRETLEVHRRSDTDARMAASMSTGSAARSDHGKKGSDWELQYAERGSALYVRSFPVFVNPGADVASD